MISWQAMSEDESVAREASRYTDMSVQAKWDCFRDIMNYMESVRRSTRVDFLNDNVELGCLWAQFARLSRCGNRPAGDAENPEQ